MQNLSFRRTAPGALVLAALAIVVGCGGGGGGGGSSSTTSTNSGASTSTASTSTASTNTGTTATGTTSTDGSTNTTGFTTAGALLSDTVYYANLAGFTDVGLNYDVRYTSPDGASKGTYATNPNADIVAVAPDPSAAGRVVFAAIPSGSSSYGIYRNTSLTTNGAEVLVAPAYSDVTSIQPSPDGNRVIYVAAIGTAALRLYSVPTTSGSSPTNIDQANFASLSYDGTKVVYSKDVSSTNTDIYIRVLGATNSIRVTNNARYDDYPQFSKDGNTVVFSESSADDVNRELLATAPATASATITTYEPVAGGDHRYPSFNEAGDRISFSCNSAVAGASGLYVTNAGSAFSAATLLVPTDNNAGVTPLATYWTSSQGRGVGRGLSFGLNTPHRR